MGNLATTAASSQVSGFHPGRSSYPGSYKSCQHPQLFIEEKGPHIGVSCAKCLGWRKWIRRSKARRHLRSNYTSRPARVTASTVSLTTPYPEITERIIGSVVDAPNIDLTGRVEKLERAFDRLRQAIDDSREGRSECWCASRQGRRAGCRR